jgi:hypothetical protein
MVGIIAAHVFGLVNSLANPDGNHRGFDSKCACDPLQNFQDWRCQEAGWSMPSQLTDKLVSTTASCQGMTLVVP